MPQWIETINLDILRLCTNNMRIGFDLRVLSTGRVTGVEEYTLQLAKHLVPEDANNLYTFYYNAATRKLDPYFDNREVVATTHPNRLQNFSAKILGVPFLDEITKSDLFFSPHFLLTPLKRAPRILMVHDLSFLRFPQFFSLRQHVWLRWMNVERQIKHADHIITPSQCTKDDVVNLLHVPEKRVSTIYHGINPIFSASYRDEEIEQFKAIHKLPESFILYLGTIEPRKNITTLIHAAELVFQKHDTISLVLAGNLGWLFEQCLEAIARSPYHNRIKLIQVSSEDRPKLYQAARVFVYPSFFEGFGFQPLEAQYSQTPVVASNRASLPEILGESALLVDPYNRLDIAEAISVALTEEKTRNRLIRLGKENAVQFNWNSAVAHYRNCFALFN
ncbi:MAG: glycosyltransferase family 4 protein [Patescibacteria group bacterium]|nr:glycosyltransferase family 4 protein [Patescibacteria group bacterium]MDE2437842.1 glycosyltransferase family 4 protein [Patescibacteria group bacterium]